MKAIDFVKWLKGYISAIENKNRHTINILKKLDEVDDSEPLPTFPSNKRDFDNDDGMVPFYTICPCNPRKGGSGVCNCTMANKMVYPPNFSILD